MSSEETVRALFAAFAARDADAALALLDPSCEFAATGTGARAGVTEPYRGHDGLRQYFADTERLWERLEVHPQDFRSAGTGVICFGVVEGHARGEPEPIRLPVIWVFRLRAGRVLSGRVAETAAEAADLAS